MLQAIRRLWVGSGPVEFESAYDLDESVQRLRDVTKRWGLFSPTEVAAGRVTASRVSLQRVIPMFGNSFKPFFVGRFERRANKVVLVGRFTMTAFTKVFMLLWLGIVACVTLVGGVAAMHSPRAAPMPFMGVGMLLFAVLLVRFGSWLSRRDAAWLSELIQHALGSPGMASGAATSTLAGESIGPASFPIKVAAVLALFGVMGAVSAITGIQSYQAGPGGAIISHYHDMASRYFAGVFGVVLLTLAYGIYRRRMLAWRFAFVVGGCGWLWQMVFLFLGGGMRAVPQAVLLLFGVISFGIMIVWGRWWYAQQVHFQQDERVRGSG